MKKDIVIVVGAVLVAVFLIGFVFLVRENISLREENARLYEDLNRAHKELNEFLAETCQEEEGVFYTFSFWNPARGERSLQGICFKKLDPSGIWADFYFSTDSVLEIQKVDD